MILLDANVLVYAVNADSPQHAASRAILDAALSGDLSGALIPQVLLEFFAVVTNARRVPAPLAPDVAWQQVTALRAGLPLLDVSPAAFDELDRLMQSVPPRGAGSVVFDLFLAAQMRAHRITTLCTYNTADFASIAGITAVTPEALRATLPG
jgi:hypothetical protein